MPRNQKFEFATRSNQEPYGLRTAHYGPAHNSGQYQSCINPSQPLFPQHQDISVDEFFSRFDEIYEIDFLQSASQGSDNNSIECPENPESYYSCGKMIEQMPTMIDEEFEPCYAQDLQGMKQEIFESAPAENKTPQKLRKQIVFEEIENNFQSTQKMWAPRKGGNHGNSES